MDTDQETIMDPALLGILQMAYEANNIEKTSAILDAELCDLVQGSLRMSVADAQKTEQRRILSIALKRAQRIIFPETAEVEAELDTIIKALIDKVTPTTDVSDIVNRLVGVVTLIRLQKLSY